MILLDGKTISEKILLDLRSRIQKLGSKLLLSVILIGNDPSSLKYVSLKQQKCQEIGIKFDFHHLPENTSQDKLISLISKLNHDPEVTGFFIQLPLPSHIDKKLVLSKIDIKKDVDGLNPNSDFNPAVVDAIVSLLQNYQIIFTDKKVVIINDSDLIGKPLLKFFPQAILCNHQTQNLSDITRSADLLISATGVKNIITANMVREGSIVVDVANGDVDFTAVSPKCSYITPTFGGIGPMTIACLLKNLTSSALAHQRTKDL
ncbi:MAG: bifunctional 5,10-methylenetetrahydrofolate dehydrogenase/5,10-methenyltetrahydrofolate cyclohydrolase [Candidatus Shapirobacteria bacterium]|jgi:methylenetetrahydrofolate dehydrogenase (NADP+)/methenyltetrahydrofolate cyclohydrolase